MSEIKCPKCGQYHSELQALCANCRTPAPKEKRVACSDGSCTGAIGSDGKCRTCGRPQAQGLKAASSTRKCPYCAESIQRDAIKCRHCGEFLDGRTTTAPSQTIVADKKSKTTAALLAFFLGGLGIHRFYLGKSLTGLLYLIFCWTFIPAFLGFIEGILFLITSETAFDKTYN